MVARLAGVELCNGILQTTRLLRFRLFQREPKGVGEWGVFIRRKKAAFYELESLLTIRNVGIQQPVFVIQLRVRHMIAFDQLVGANESVCWDVVCVKLVDVQGNAESVVLR